MSAFHLPNRWFRAGLMCGALLPATLCAQTSRADAAQAPKLTLLAPRIEPAPQQSGRYTLKARFAAQESAGQLREGGEFSLIGRIAKAAAGCDASAIFSNGFEGN